MNPGDGEAVFANARKRTDPLRRRQIGDDLHTLFAPLINVDHAARGLEERFDARDVVAHVIDQLIVTRDARAMKLTHEMSVIGRGVERPQVAAESALLAIFVDHRIPAYTVIWRLDQRECKIAQRALIIGQVVDGNRRSGMRCRLLADPSVDIVGNQGDCSRPKSPMLVQPETSNVARRTTSGLDPRVNRTRGDMDVPAFSGASCGGGRLWNPRVAASADRHSRPPSRRIARCG